MTRSSPSLAHLILHHLILGLIGAAVLGTILLWFDVGGLRTLIIEGEQKVFNYVVFYVSLMVPIGGIAVVVGLFLKIMRPPRP